jgi:hypothetical protein
MLVAEYAGVRVGETWGLLVKAARSLGVFGLLGLPSPRNNVLIMHSEDQCI